MNAITLQPLDLMASAPSLEDDLLEITTPLPHWLIVASEPVRQAFTEKLIAYHACAKRLEAHLGHVLPTFEDFVREQLAARIKTDLGLDIDPDVVVLDVPKRVWRDYDIDPQYGRVTNYAAPWIAGSEREQMSLSELARRNFLPDDEEMAARLDFAIIDQNLSQPATRLTPAYLHAVIPQLDVAHAYRVKLRAVFRVPDLTSLQGMRQADLLLEPYERQIQLQAFCEAARKRISEQGYQMLTLAAQARSKAETDAAHLETCWLQFKPGTSVSGDRDSQTLAGLCAIRDRLTDRTLIYLPDAPLDIGLIEASAPALALSRLIELLISQPAMIDYLADRTPDSENKARHVSYINQALARGFEGFIQIVPALDLQLAAQQLQTRAGSLDRMTQARARSRFDLQRERNWQQSETCFMYFRAMLCLLPGIGTLFSLQDGWHSGHEAAKAFREGRLDDGLVAAGGVALSVLDVVLSIVPGAASIHLLTRLGRSSAGFRSATSIARQHVIKPFEGYEVQTSLAGALPQTGRDIGTLLKNGQLWIEREHRVYAVYRRSGEQTLRLKKTATHGYEPPVRFEQGAWGYHSDVGLKGGVRSAIAETIIAKAHADPSFKNRQARQLLDEFEFPPEHQRRMELDLAIHYEKHQAIPDWAEAYRRGEGPTHASPQPGPSGSQRDELSGEGNQANRAPEAGHASVTSAQNGPDSWKNWARPLAGPDGLEQIQVQPPIFRMAGEPAGDFIQIDGSRYDILPGGGSQHPSIVFLKNPNRFEDSFSGLNESIRQNRYDQPIMASFEDGQWTVHGPLFKQKIQQLVEQARPGMTPMSNRVLAEKLFERADSAQSGLNASRLINMKATLNAWRSGQLAPLPDLNDPLLMLNGSRMFRIGTLRPRLSLSYGPSLQTFNRLDFAVNEPSLAQLLIRATTETTVRDSGRQSMRTLMSQLLTRSGYTLVLADSAALKARYILCFKRPGQDALYMLYTRRFRTPTPGFELSSLDSALPMSNRWVDEWLAAHQGDISLDPLVQARSQGRLVKMIGGVKIRGTTEAGIQVFVQRIADDF